MKASDKVRKKPVKQWKVIITALIGPSVVAGIAAVMNMDNKKIEQ